MSYRLIDAKSLGELCQIVDCEHKTAPYVANSPYLVVRTNNVRNGQLVFEGMKYTTEEGYKEWTKRTVPRYCDVLFTREAPAGETCLIPKGLNICMGQRMVLLRPNIEYVDSRFLQLILITEQCKSDISRLSIGSTVLRINIADIKKLKIASPPLPEQKKIAEILSTWDRAIEVTEKLLNNSQQQKKSLMQQLLTGKKRLPGFSGAWLLKKIGSVCTAFSGGTPSRSKPQYYGGNIPWIKSGDVNNRFIYSVSEHITEDGLSNSSAKCVKKDSILIAMYGATAGKVAINFIEDAAINQAILSVTPNTDCSYIFMFYLLEMEMNKALRLVQGGQPNFNASIIKNIKISVPPLEEQQKIASAFSTADKEIETLQQKLNYLKQEKKALMQQLLTGKRRVVL